ncbi:MAG: hypothetical protein U9Q83_01300 [Bacteroidota bacterium]|nr:hypothetical protein [Bacteroidota bacterium]
MKKSIFLIILSSLFVILYSSCKNDKNGDDNLIDSTDYSQFNEENFFASVDQAKVKQLNAIIEGFVSPVEMAAMIKNNHIEFSKEYLLSTSITQKYETNIKKALGLGLLSADLGYLNIYKKTGQMVNYLIAINNIAGDLRVAQFFDFQSLKKLVTQSDNMDSLLFMTVSSFHQIDRYFTQTNRSFLTVLSVTGVWLESSYLITQAAKDNPVKNFKDQIGSQKDLLNQLIEIIKVYKGHPQFDFIIAELKKLQTAYSPVKISIKEVEGKVEIVDGNYVIYPDEETVIEMPDGTMDKIIDVTEKTRNAIVNIK